jgi:uncharacterized phage-associated protein
MTNEPLQQAKKFSKKVNEKTRYSAEEVADFFVFQSRVDNRPITNKKLQKLLYYAQAWSLVLNKKKLFNENIEAWIHGPVVPEIYKKYKKYGASDISGGCESVAVLEKIREDHETYEVLMEVWNLYGKFDGDYLEVLTHSEDPWLKTREGLDKSESSNLVISEQIIKDYYFHKLQNAQQLGKSSN